ncbi:MAG: hypothetical protein CME69_06760 [Halobacteriovorax sp.]|nr:hypothetical protein [Halobacteriovorax sp.]|tara:strand:+ start:1034 stop:1330 length:297 start_codon:yes stop_codon:yes gene_type:complete
MNDEHLKKLIQSDKSEPKEKAQTWDSIQNSIRNQTNKQEEQIPWKVPLVSSLVMMTLLIFYSLPTSHDLSTKEKRELIEYINSDNYFETQETPYSWIP